MILDPVLLLSSDELNYVNFRSFITRIAAIILRKESIRAFHQFDLYNWNPSVLLRPFLLQYNIYLVTMSDITI